MRQLLYVSNTMDELGLGDLDQILTASRRNNAMMSITGLLLFIDGGFLQVLEGEERAVRELYTRISSDPRHRNTRLMLDREVPSRAFPEWNMALSGPAWTIRKPPACSGVAREAIHGRLSPGTGRIVAMMLQTFYAVQHSDLPLNLYYAG